VATTLADGRHDGVFPLILGEVRQTNGSVQWSPIAVGETPMVNLRAPRAGRTLDDEEVNTFRLADGTRSVREVCGVKDDEAFGSDDIAARRLAFVLDALGDGLGLAFERPWEP
jgi:hypothetical protein